MHRWAHIISKNNDLANLTPPNKQSDFKVKSDFKSRDHVSNLKTIKKFLFGGVKNMFLCFKQLPLLNKNLYLHTI